MPNVWDAMKKHQAEEMAKAEAIAKAKAAKTAQLEKVAQAKPPTSEGKRVAQAQAKQMKKAPSVPTKVPRMGSGGRKYSPCLMPHHDRGGPIAEQYRALRTNLMARAVNDKMCTMITSAEAGEGKTVTALNLALVLAERQELRTLVVDCDLRKGKVATLLGQTKTPGMANLLRDQVSLKDVIRQTAYPNVFYIPSGEILAEQVGELITKPKLEDVFIDLRRKYDFIIVDTPPVNSVADAGIIGRTIDEAILIVRMNKTSRDSVERSVRLLHAAEIKVSGMVLTRQEYFIPNYLYRYS